MNVRYRVELSQAERGELTRLTRTLETAASPPSGEFAVPLCRTHHREVHRARDECACRKAVSDELHRRC
jgi:hypothetical protein